jgi:alpha-glucosidase
MSDGSILWSGPRGVVVRSTLQVALPHSVEEEESNGARAAPASHAIAFGDRPAVVQWSGAVASGALKGSACLDVKVQLRLIAEAAASEEGAEEWRVANQLRGCVEATSFDGAGADAYGGGEVCGSLCLSGRRVVAWCSDVPFYDDRNVSMYQAHAWMLLLMRDGSACGVLLDTTYRCTLDATAIKTDARVSFSVPLGDPALLHPAHRRHWQVDVYRLFGAHPVDVSRALAKLTGRMPMPPRWALGYQQCRWSYYPDERAVEVAAEFRRRRIPCDVLWFDIHYMHRYRVFTFDPATFPNPADTNNRIHLMGFHTVWMIDPGVGDDRAAPPRAASSPPLTRGVCASGTAADVWVKRTAAADSEPYVGNVWPGPCLFPDFTADRVQQWWAGLYKSFAALGVDGVWNDMNEPAVFDSPTKTMPLTVWHAGYGAPHAFVHNVYGMLMAEATRKGLQAARPDKRPFVLTRAGGVGSQRAAATWTGDNSSDARHFRWSIPMVLQLGLSGQPFCGPDIGGFFGDAHAKLFARWMAVGTLLPLARAHSADGTAPHEPWAFGDECEATCRVAISRRYRLLPEFYSLFRRAHQTGMPVVRPLFYAAPSDPALRNEDSGFLIGDDLLVLTPPDFFSETVLPDAERDALEAAAQAKRDAAIKNGTARSAFGGLIDPDDPDPLSKMGPLSTDPAHPMRIVPPKISRASLRDAEGTPMPHGRNSWIPLDDIINDPIDCRGANMDDLPSIWLRRGSVVALGPVLQSTANIVSNEYVADVVVALAARPRATAYGVIYEDDGDGHEHQRAGRYRETTYHAEVQDTIEEIIIQRRVSGGGADYAQFAQVRVFCFLGNGPAVIGRLDAGDDTLTIVMPPMSGFSLALPSLAGAVQADDNALDLASPRDHVIDEQDAAE